MQVSTSRRAVRIEEAVPFGEVCLVPSDVTGRPETVSSELMAAALRDTQPDTAAEVLMRLRQAFPQTPLSARISALGYLLRR